MSKNMLTRILSGAVLLIFTLTCNHFGGLVLLVPLLFLAEIGLFEFYRATSVLGDGQKCNSLALNGYVLCALYYILLYFDVDRTFLIAIFVLQFVVTMTILVVTYPKYNAGQISYSIMGFLYLPLMLSFLFYIRNMEYGIYLIWLVYVVSWVCDTFAYFVGMAIGKHKLAPVLSPKKSIEGAIGGVLGAVLVGFLYGYFLIERVTPGRWIGIVVVCALGSVISQIGDLSASAIKRNHDIKDYGNLIPGHGGVLDRFDSVIITAPMVYFLLYFVETFYRL